MSTRTRELRSREPELDAEQEVDFGRYARAVALRWWLPLAGLLAGAAIGYLISLGASEVWKASATVYLGQPYSAVGGGTAIQGKQTNPAAVNTIVRSEEAIERAARDARMKPSELRGKVSTGSVSTGTGAVGPIRIQQNPLVRVTVQASGARKASAAANSLGRQVVTKLASYAKAKIALLEQNVADAEREIEALRAAVRGADTTTAAILAVQLGNVQDDRLSAQQQLTQAREVELPSVLTRAVAVKTTARSRRNDVVVAAFLGLLIGLAAALLWEPVSARRRG